MSLRVDQIGIEVRTPATLEAEGRWCASALEQRLASSIAPFLGPSLERRNEVIRIRELTVVMHVRAGDLTPEKIVDAWLSAFARQLFEKLALPSDPDTWGVYREESHAVLRARFLRELLRGGAANAWYYREFLPVPSLDRAGAVMEILRGGITIDILDALVAIDALDGALAVMDAVHLETLMRQLSDGPQSINLASAILVLEAALAKPCPEGWKPHGHRNALRVWAEVRRRGGTLRPRDVLSLLRAARSIRAQGFVSAPGEVDDAVKLICAEATQPGSSAMAAQVQALAANVFPDVEYSPSFSADWLTSEYAGLLLLLPLVERSSWWRIRSDARFADPFFSILLAGVALDLCQVSAAAGLQDPAVYTFSCSGGPVSPLVFESFLASADWAAAAAELGFAANSAVALMHQMAERLAEQFAAQVRSLQALKPASIRRLFVKRSGRFAIVPDQLQVVLESNPYNIVLHIAGADSIVDTSSWFEHRRLIYLLEGL